MSALICGSMAYDTIMGEPVRFDDALNGIVGAGERPRQESRGPGFLASAGRASLEPLRRPSRNKSEKR